MIGQKTEVLFKVFRRFGIESSETDVAKWLKVNIRETCFCLF